MHYFYKKQQSKYTKKYEEYLQTVGALSNLYSDSSTPFLYYRVAEKVFCRSFEAEDLSRSDVSADAKKDNIGLGLKTFLIGNGKTFQKIAEFNAQLESYRELDDKSLILKIAELRNKRILFTHRTYGIKKSIYHCIVRDESKFLIFEEPMFLIDIHSLKNIKKGSTGTTISFQDKNAEYKFLISKSTLTKRFITNRIEKSFKVEILKEPLDELQAFFKSKKSKFGKKIKETVFLPLYAKNKEVHPKSALNSWNASQKNRKRHHDEVYISIPKKVHNISPNFFPDRDTVFDLKLPDGKILQSKVCQDNSKALMSYSNKELGQWILRQVLNLDPGELLTYKKLVELNIDSVRIDKINDNLFEINFSTINSYENWIESMDIKTT